MADGGLAFTIVAWGPVVARMAKSCIARVDNSLSRSVFGHAPARPAVNKWKKLGPCVDAVLVGVLVHNILPAAFESLKFPIARRVVSNSFLNRFYTF